MSVLDKIVRYKKEEVASLRRKVTLEDVKKKAGDASPARSFLSRFEKSQINIIAEIKKASPSAGIIREDFRPLDLSFRFEDNGAKALSILTDEHFFQGSLTILEEARKRVSLPCLRKDFTLGEYHIYEARGAGGDAVLLIAAILDSHQLEGFSALCLELGMTPIVEIHSSDELRKALLPEPCVIGVNNRDLKKFTVNLETSHRLIREIPKTRPAISESGISGHDDLVKLVEAGFAGFLIGETLMKAANPGEKLGELIGVHPD